MLLANITGAGSMVIILVLVSAVSGILWCTKGRVLHEAERLFSKLRGTARHHACVADRAPILNTKMG